MKALRLAPFTLAALSISAAALSASPAPAETPERPTDHTLGKWLEDRMVRPVQPFELVPGKDPNGWGFMIEPYGWSPGLYGRIGFKNLPTASVNQSPIDILKTLDWGFFARGEVRKGRWGILGDGFFAQFSTSTDPGAGLYKSITADSQQSMVTLAAAYRLISDKRFYLDVYGGGRWTYLGASASAEINRTGVEALSEKVINAAVAKFGPRLLAKYPGLKDVPPSVLQEAKQLGVKKLADRIGEKLPTHVQQDRWWIDPIVGLRGQLNFSRWLFAAAQADAGGFGVGSQITLNTQATLGVNFSRNIAFEAGYRYMYIDYDKDNFLYNVNMPGVFGGLIFKF